MCKLSTNYIWYNGDIFYQGIYGTVSNGFLKDGSFAMNGVTPLSLYLKENGREKDVKETYTAEDLAKLFADFNPKLVQPIDLDDVIVVDTEKLDTDIPRYCVMVKSGKTYRDINRPDRVLYGDESVAIYEDLDRITNFGKRPLCVYSLKDFLAKYELTNMINETITSLDLYDFYNKINGLNKEAEKTKTLN